MRRKKSLSLAPVLLQEKRQVERAAEPESVPAHARGIRQGHVGKALEQHRHQDVADSSPRQVRARAMMRAIAKGLVRIGGAKRVVVLAVFDDRCMSSSLASGTPIACASIRAASGPARAGKRSTTSPRGSRSRYAAAS